MAIESLLQRVATGNQEAVNECLSRYGDLVWSLCLRMLESREEAEDLVQEVFITLWKNASRFDPQKGKESAFIAMITRRKIIDRLRQKKRQPLFKPLEQENLSHNTEDLLERSEDLSHIKECWNQLDPAQQQVLQLVIYHGYSYPEVSEELKIPLGTVKSRARQGIIKLREIVHTQSHTLLSRKENQR